MIFKIHIGEANDEGWRQDLQGSSKAVLNVRGAKIGDEQSIEQN